MSRSKSYAPTSDYFNLPDDNPNLDWAGYCEYLDSLEEAFDAVQEYRGEQIARGFDSFDAMLADAERGNA
jgi:hypothetical protein